MELSGPHAATAVELKARMEAERVGVPFLIVRDGAGAQRLIVLDEGCLQLTIGRSEDCDVPLSWDGQVSRVHAELVNGSAATGRVEDGGLSRNGSYVNGERLFGAPGGWADGETPGSGHTEVLFRSAGGQRPARRARPWWQRTRTPAGWSCPQAQRAVMRALCRPFAGGAEFARPATNQEIARELVLSLEAVKGHLRVLFAKFELDRSAAEREAVCGWRSARWRRAR